MRLGGSSFARGGSREAARHGDLPALVAIGSVKGKSASIDTSVELCVSTSWAKRVRKAGLPLASSRQDRSPVASVSAMQLVMVIPGSGFVEIVVVDGRGSRHGGRRSHREPAVGLMWLVIFGRRSRRRGSSGSFGRMPSPLPSCKYPFLASTRLGFSRVDAGRRSS